MMKIKKKNILMLSLMALVIGFTASCSKMDVGYLRTEGASFTPDSLKQVPILLIMSYQVSRLTVLLLPNSL